MKALDSPTPPLALASQPIPRNVVHRDMTFDEYFEASTESSPVQSYNSIDIYSPDGKLHCNQNLQFERMLGSGSFADVYLAKINNCPVAIKILKNFNGPKKEQTFARELAALRRVQGSDHAIQLLGYRPAPFHWFIFPFMNEGTLSHRIKTGAFTMDQKLDVLIQLASALRSLHQLNPPLFHRDVTTENCLLHDGRCILADFGVAVDYDAVEMTSDDPELALSPNGNPRYRAPEVRKGSAYTLSAEVYMFGSVLYEVLTGKPPFEKHEATKAASLIQQGERPVVDRCSAEEMSLTNLLNACWSADPSARPTFDDIISFLEGLQRQRQF